MDLTIIYDGFGNMKITGTTKHLCVIGDPISHSFSPLIHNFISEQMGLDYTYSAYWIKENELSGAISAMRTLKITGMNVTAPHKIEVIKYIDALSDDAQKLGSVNTIANKGGVLVGHNTDGEGFYLSLVNAGIGVTGKNILVMGCGGVVIPMLVRIISENPKSVTILNRTMSKAETVAKTVYDITGYTLETEIKADDFDLVINTTTAGMANQKDAFPWDSIEALKNRDFINSGTAAVDMIYNPQKTKFLEFAEKKGAKILNGLDMLIYQAVLAYEIFTDTKLPSDIADKIKKEVFGI